MRGTTTRLSDGALYYKNRGSVIRRVRETGWKIKNYINVDDDDDNDGGGIHGGIEKRYYAVYI